MLEVNGESEQPQTWQHRIAADCCFQSQIVYIFTEASIPTVETQTQKRLGTTETRFYIRKMV